MNIGDIVVYTPASSRETEGKPRCIVVGVLPESDFDTELIWVCGISNSYAFPNVATLEEAADWTKV